MERRPTTHDISWFLDINSKGQLDLDPSYQRRSVWTPKDRSFFLDSVLRNFPTAPIFLHSTRDEKGTPTYHVVDGKQRLETVIMFSQGKIRAPRDFGDTNINNRKFEKLSPQTKDLFWDYIFSVEFVKVTDGALVNEVFDRLNRNARSLARQELRHARFEGDFMSKMEAESDGPLWGEIGISTRARARRMRDVEFIAELWLLTMHGPTATTADRLDDYFAEYDEGIPDYEDHARRFERTKAHVTALQSKFDITKTRYRNFADFYSLFGALLERESIDPVSVGEKLAQLESDVSSAQEADGRTEQSSAVDEKTTDEEHPTVSKGIPKDAIVYYQAARGASNDKKERLERIAVLRTRLFGEPWQQPDESI